MRHEDKVLMEQKVKNDSCKGMRDITIKKELRY